MHKAFSVGNVEGYVTDSKDLTAQIRVWNYKTNKIEYHEIDKNTLSKIDNILKKENMKEVKSDEI